MHSSEGTGRDSLPQETWRNSYATEIGICRSVVLDRLEKERAPNFGRIAAPPEEAEPRIRKRKLDSNNGP